MSTPRVPPANVKQCGLKPNLVKRRVTSSNFRQKYTHLDAKSYLGLPPDSRYHHATRTRTHGPRIDEYYSRDGLEEESQSLGNHSSCHALELNRAISIC